MNYHFNIGKVKLNVIDAHADYKHWFDDYDKIKFKEIIVRC